MNGILSKFDAEIQHNPQILEAYRAVLLTVQEAAIIIARQAIATLEHPSDKEHREKVAARVAALDETAASIDRTAAEIQNSPEYVIAFLLDIIDSLRA